MGIKIKGFNRVASYSGLLLAAFFGLIIFPISLAIDSTEATVTPSTTTLTLSTSDISAEITPNNANGTFVASDPAIVSVTTNNYSGYTLGITANNNTDNTKLINTDDNTAYLTSISSASAPADFNANNWGYLPSKLNGTANTQYQPAPTTTATTLEATTAANPTANEYTIALGAKADYTLPEGTYENTFTLTAVANPVSYAITYDKNTTDTVTNMPADQSGTIETTDIIVASNTPARAGGYTFQGWCTTTPTTVNYVDSCNSTTYQPGDVINTSKTTSNNYTLYALWQARSFTINFDANGGTGTMASQVIYGDSATLISNTFSKSSYIFDKWTTNTDGTGTSYNNGATFTVPASGTSVTLYAQWRFPFAQEYTNVMCSSQSHKTVVDSRVSVTYSVRKVGSLCWIDGMRIPKGATLTSSNSNVNTAYTMPNTSLTSGDSYIDGRSAQDSSYTNVYFYNYCAATAGTICNSSSTANATYDICPKGWRMPTSAEADIGSSIGGALTMNTSYYSGGTAVQDGGRLPNSEGYRLYLKGYMWTSTAYSSTNRYSAMYMYTTPSSAPGPYAIFYGSNITNGSKVNGYRVYCVHPS